MGYKNRFLYPICTSDSRKLCCVETYCAEILRTHNIFVIDLQLAAIVNICDETLCLEFRKHAPRWRMNDLNPGSNNICQRQPCKGLRGHPHVELLDTEINRIRICLNSCL